MAVIHHVKITLQSFQHNNCEIITGYIWWIVISSGGRRACNGVKGFVKYGSSRFRWQTILRSCTIDDFRYLFPVHDARTIRMDGWYGRCNTFQSSWYLSLTVKEIPVPFDILLCVHLTTHSRKHRAQQPVTPGRTSERKDGETGLHFFPGNYMLNGRSHSMTWF